MLLLTIFRNIVYNSINALSNVSRGIIVMI